ncbi:kinase-like domain-containing protein [Lactarius quietus]|nr:kinase-like domain-containing protein [Lactarius quietus]
MTSRDVLGMGESKDSWESSLSPPTFLSNHPNLPRLSYTSLPAAAALAIAMDDDTWSRTNPITTITTTTGKPADHVYYDLRAPSRRPLFRCPRPGDYRLALETAIDLNVRGAEVERSLAGVQEDRQLREFRRHTRTDSQFLRIRRTNLKIGLRDFRTVKEIGKGAFGEVWFVFFPSICCCSGSLPTALSDMPFVVRHFKKVEMLKRDQLAHVRAVRGILSESTSYWVVQLYYSFQDSRYLYLIMEFLPGGDLMTMLMKYDVFSEDVTWFYMAECTLAIEAVHNLGFIHRDIKPL